MSRTPTGPALSSLSLMFSVREFADSAGLALIRLRAMVSSELHLLASTVVEPGRSNR